MNNQKDIVLKKHFKVEWSNVFIMTFCFLFGCLIIYLTFFDTQETSFKLKIFFSTFIPITVLGSLYYFYISYQYNKDKPKLIVFGQNIKYSINGKIYERKYEEVELFEHFNKVSTEKPDTLIIHFKDNNYLKIGPEYKSNNDLLKFLKSKSDIFIKLSEKFTIINELKEKERKRIESNQETVYGVLFSPGIIYIVYIMCAEFLYDFKGYYHYQVLSNRGIETLAEIKEKIVNNGVSKFKYVKIKYIVEGEEYLKRRKVKHELHDEYEERDLIKIVYLKEDPNIFRVPDYDLDSRKIFIYFFIIPIVALAAYGLYIILHEYIYKNKDKINSYLLTTLENTVIICNYDFTKEQLFAAIKDSLNEEAYIVIFEFTLSNDINEESFIQDLEEHKIDIHLIEERFILLDPENVKRYISLLGDGTFEGLYNFCVVPYKTLSESTDWIKEKLAPQNVEELSAAETGSTLFYEFGVLGTYSKNTSYKYLENLIQFEINEFYMDKDKSTKIFDEIKRSYRFEFENTSYLFGFYEDINKKALDIIKEDEKYSFKVSLDKKNHISMKRNSNIPIFITGNSFFYYLFQTLVFPFTLLFIIIEFIIKPFEYLEKKVQSKK